MFGVQRSLLLVAALALGHTGAIREKLCDDPTFDTIFSGGAPNDTIYVFKGDDYWTLVPSASGEVYVQLEELPGRISDFWPGLPGGINAAFTNYTDHVTYFFKGSEYWQYDRQQPLPGFPRKIADDFPGVPNDVRIAFRCSGKVYFFKDGEFWTYRPTRSPAISGKNPRSIHGSWLGVPDGVTSAVQLSTGVYTHFFQDSLYYKLLVSNNSVVGAAEPLDTKWLGCEDFAVAAITAD